MRFIINKFFILPLLLIISLQAYATHNRAGEITFKQISIYTYEVTLITYTDSRSINADRPEVTLKWGDNTESEVKRYSQTQKGNNTFLNIYVAKHTYPGPGTYLIQFQDPNRIEGILNMQNSVNTPFYVETQLQINPGFGFNHSPILLQPPIDFAEVNQVFIHNPNAYDPDGDSLVFTLIPPKQSPNLDVDLYTNPRSSNFFQLDKYTGTLTWNTPVKQGIYNIAILIDEYRNKRKIGYVIRDMQIIVQDGTNRPPVIKALKDTCVEAGKSITLKFRVEASDPDQNQTLELTGTGGPFIQTISKAVMIDNPATGSNPIHADFSWTIACEHIRREPYRVVFRAVDNDPRIPLSDLKNIDIKVVGPAPENLQSSAFGNGINLTWTKPICPNKGYFIYRKADSSNWQHAYCETGVPSYTGFQLIDTILDPNILKFYDDNRGEGLSPGVNYCYRITAIYLNEGNFDFVEGYSSGETCAELVKDVPVITNISVRTTNANTGSMYVAWSKPTEIDTLQSPGPYTYKLFRSPDANGKNWTEIRQFTNNTFALFNDTIFIDTNINTVQRPYSYKVEFYNTLNNQPNYIGKTVTASSIFLRSTPKHKKIILSWQVNVPWKNLFYVIYRHNDSTGKWDSIGATNKLQYTDTGLVNGSSYCYYVKSSGSYFSPGFVNPIINLSQQLCTSPRDTIAPCEVTLQADKNCDLRQSTLNWKIINPDCNADVVKYRIYFSNRRENNFVLIDSINGINENTFTDRRETLQYSLAGCYVVTAVDSFDNESKFSNEFCVDNCPQYRLPNVFTPNDDGANDLFMPMRESRFVESIDLKIFNRWGQEVFSTKDPSIKWDGKDQQSGNLLPAGVYYYIYTANLIYLESIQTTPVKQGTISLIY